MHIRQVHHCRLSCENVTDWLVFLHVATQSTLFFCFHSDSITCCALIFPTVGHQKRILTRQPGQEYCRCNGRATLVTCSKVHFQFCIESARNGGNAAHHQPNTPTQTCYVAVLHSSITTTKSISTHFLSGIIPCRSLGITSH